MAALCRRYLAEPMPECTPIRGYRECARLRHAVKAQQTRTTIIVVLVVGLVAIMVLVGVILLGGGDDRAPSGSTRPEQLEGGDGGNGEPRLRTVASKRSKGDNVAVATTAKLDKPKEIWLRVSAAPKQAVVGEWFVGCGADNFERQNFKVTPPSLQQLRIPPNDAPSCFVRGRAQLLGGKGRLKVAILRDR